MHAKKTLPQLEIGSLPPQYLGKDSDGNKLNLEEMKGKIVIITFWASWCPPCIKELPYLERIQDKLGTKNIQTIAINYKESRKHYRRIKKRFSDSTLILAHDQKGILAKKFGVDKLPNLFLIDKEGRLAYHGVGYKEESLVKIIDVINKQLAKPDS